MCASIIPSFGQGHIIVKHDMKVPKHIVGYVCLFFLLYLLPRPACRMAGRPTIVKFSATLAFL